MCNADDLLKEVATYGQTCLEKFPVIVLGSGASIPHGLPSMDGLKAEINNIRLSEEKENQQSDLDKLKEELKSNDLETALSNINNNELQGLIRKTIWESVNCADLKLRDKLLKKTENLSLVRLFNHQLKSTNSKLSVVTTNYDRVVEYAADLTKNFWFTGFSHGHICWPKDVPTNLNISARIHAGHDKYIQVWKVHGSLDWFHCTSMNDVTSLPNCPKIPNGFSPTIIPPSRNKYEDAHQEPYRTIISNADTALSNATSYLCIGYGFNDTHIQPKLIEHWKSSPNLPLLILTKKMTPNTLRVLNENNSLKYLALEESEEKQNSTKMYSSSYPNGEIITNVSLWQLDNFLTHCTGRR